MRRFFVDPQLLQDDLVSLPPEILRHLQVLRMEQGDRICLLDGAGLLCEARLLRIDRQKALAGIEKRCRVSETALSVTLFQGLPKGDKFELVLQKGTEIGISDFVPVLCRRSQVKTPGRRMQRWNRIVAEAARQSGRNLLPRLSSPLELAAGLAGCDADLRLVPWEEATTPLAERLPATPPRSAALLIGPEGGLSPEEIELATAYGFQPVSLGPRILRTETAGFVVAGILQYLYGDLGRFSSPNEPSAAAETARGRTCPEPAGGKERL
ncbi:16S rRNA (uracil1498-N3)-methyltransferase [Geothermobacter ehrlichii]|uniref:Ribosomal RNA small subunit methyltransferase E n=1 Tax=Geothermobacter ehrlichii TaxID=213224 RepID=A0A5D3WIW1_9BACT|nr:16S rRNA (uracil(1498)-N(3))-methyltransferase [Geothermobacter ehrlichii]TYO98105.1 16S rRNA (uracil1498-N3)-methyltransferase [Geothermobacter ehrlichii]